MRELLELALVDAARLGAPLALLYLDLDGFKAVNDLHGHDAGDRVLIEVARRLQAGLRQGDAVARIGGDEFVALLPRCDGTAARSIVEALQTRLALPYEVAHATLRVGASIGAAAYPADAQQVDTLMARADAAMYAEKRAHAGSPA